MRATFEFDFPTPDEAKAAASAIMQETEFKKRGSSEVKVSGKTLTIKISADDAVSLRAASNSYLRLMQIILTIRKPTKNR
jgi:tRNA threonylcarbamoyladenosine modification (KEOPS) complex  Pcc1 subunit